MEQFNAHKEFLDAGDDLNNIIRINNNTDTEDDDDYDFDYDPNEMYYALNGRD